MQKSKKIAVNTIILYVKLITNILIGLYTSRVVLLTLGASDFGLYSVVGGIVILLNVVGTTMVNVSYRYMCVEIGKGEKGNPNKIYNTVLLIHFFLAMILLLGGGLIGHWYIINYLNVAPYKIDDALFVLYLSLVATAFSVLAVPSNGLIFARENFLFISIIEILQKLAILLFLIFILTPSNGNKLRLYALFIAFVNIFNPLCYVLYCKIKDSKIVRYKINKNLNDYKGILKFASWILLGAIAFIFNSQGLAMIINFSYGTVINASFGIANTVKSYINQFVGTIGQAAAPQITQNISGDNERKGLVIQYQTIKYTFFSMLIVSLPVIASIKGILIIWLKKVPEQTDVFVILFLLSGMIAVFGSGLDTMLQAIGKLKFNQISYTITKLLVLPVAFFLYRAGYPAYTGPLADLFFTLITVYFQIWALCRVSKFTIKEYWTETLLPSARVAIPVFPIICLRTLFKQNILSVIVLTIIIVFWCLMCVYLFGLNVIERKKIKGYFVDKFSYR